MIKLKKLLCLAIACTALVPAAVFAENDDTQVTDIYYSEQTEIDEMTRDITVNIEVSNNTDLTPSIRIAQYDKNGLFLGFADAVNVSDNERRMKLVFTPHENSSSVKTFIWDDSYIPYSSAEKFEIPVNPVSALTDDEREIVGYIIDGLLKRSDSISIDSKYQLTKARFNKLMNTYVFPKIQLEHPELFYVNPEYQYTISDGYVRSLMADYSMTEDEIAEANKLIAEEVKKVTAMTDESMTDIQKALIVHDYIVSNYEYDLRAYTDTDNAVKTLDQMIIQKRGICQGYSYMFKYIMNSMGIECVTVPSNACKHMWNKIKLDGEWYNVDVTSDDPILNKSTNISHNYFLVNDSQIKSLSPTLHGKWNSRKWDGSPAEVSDSDALIFSVLQDIKGASVYKDGEFYCFDQKNNICTVDFENNALTPVYTDSAEFRWFVQGSSDRFYADKFSAMVLLDGTIYFNSPDKIYKFEPETNTAEVVYDYTADENVPADKKDISNTYFYGLCASDNKLYAEYAASAGAGVEELIEITIE